MNSKSKFAAIALLTAVGVATPAFAQGLETGTAANREQLFGTSPGQFVPYYGRQAYRANGLGAYAKVPRRAFVTRPGRHGWR
jgi:hypothetical protein